MEEDRPVSGVSWRSVALFYGIACAVSWPFFWWRDIHNVSWIAWHFPPFLKMTPIMWGPGLGALVALAVFRRRHPRTITFFGTSAGRSLAFYFIPYLGLAAIAVPAAPQPARLLLLLALFSVVGLFNILGEELGWRGFLQDALRPLPRLPRYLLIGFLWEFWHFTNRTHEGTASEIALRLALFYPATMLISFLIGEATDRGRSLLVAVTLHGWIDAVGELPEILHLSRTRLLVAVGFSLLFWGWMLWTWRSTEPPRSVGLPQES